MDLTLSSTYQTPATPLSPFTTRSANLSKQATLAITRKLPKHTAFTAFKSLLTSLTLENLTKPYISPLTLGLFGTTTSSRIPQTSKPFSQIKIG